MQCNLYDLKLDLWSHVTACHLWIFFFEFVKVEVKFLYWVFFLDFSFNSLKYQTPKVNPLKLKSTSATRLRETKWHSIQTQKCHFPAKVHWWHLSFFTWCMLPCTMNSSVPWLYLVYALVSSAAWQGHNSCFLWDATQGWEGYHYLNNKHHLQLDLRKGRPCNFVKQHIFI